MNWKEALKKEFPWLQFRHAQSVLKVVSTYLRLHPPREPVRSPVPFFARMPSGPYFFLIATADGLKVQEISRAGELIKEYEIEFFFDEWRGAARRAEKAKLAMENFESTLAPILFDE